VLDAETAGFFDSIVIADFYDFIHKRDIQDIGDKAVANSLNLMKPRLVAEQGGNVLWFHGGNSHIGLVFFQETANALKGAAAADTCCKTSDIAAHLSP